MAESTTSASAKSLQDLDIFELHPLITNLNCKLSTVCDYDSRKQLLCLVSDENEIILRYTNESGYEILKLVTWFRKTSRMIHDVSFDPTGTWLLVLCFDNTLHVVPAMTVVDKCSQTYTCQAAFSTNQITSYIIPFVGPHECPNSKKCPNHEVNTSFLEKSVTNTIDVDCCMEKSDSVDQKEEASEEAQKKVSEEKVTTKNICREDDKDGVILTQTEGKTVEEFSRDIPANMSAAATPSNVHEDKTGNSQMMASSFMCSTTCPYPLSVVWWQTIDSVNRAIIGYSDGSICFVGLSPNCPFVASTLINNGSVVKLLICKDNTFESVMLLITSSMKQQYKLLLEQKAIKYVYPGDISPSSSQNRDNDWQIVFSVKSTSNCSDPASDSSQLEEDVFVKNDDTPVLRPPVHHYTFPTTHFIDKDDDFNARSGILPAARARLASLKSLGSKKLNAIKMRLTDNRQKLEEYMPETSLSSFAIMDSPSLTPELLTTSSGSFYTIQNLRNTYLLSALHSQSNTLSVHSIDINLKPLFLNKIPKNCHEILISSNLLYSIQYVEMNETNRSTTGSDEITSAIIEEDNVNRSDEINVENQNRSTDNASIKSDHLVNAVGVISSAMASLRNGDEDKFNHTSLLGLFRFENETVLSLYQMATYPKNDTETLTKDDMTSAFLFKEIRSPMEYVQFYSTADVDKSYTLRQKEIMRSEFPKINYDPCYVVTNKNVYYIQLKKEPFAIFLDSALAGEWNQCREFCNTFDISYEVCIEFAGDYLLRNRKVAQALLTYNTARIKPIRTALKLAMYGQTYALMHLCAMALKSTYLLKSQYFCHPIIKTILYDIGYRHSEDVRQILPTFPADRVGTVVNEGAPCSDYVYNVDDSISNLQMSPSSQFHLANLLLITLAEKAVKDKNYIPLWNFLVTNTKFHTNMTSIVLCQSGLFSAALILAKARGVCIDVFIALASVMGQEFGWYSELNVCLYNLSESIFTESITYLHYVALDYLIFIQNKLESIRYCVLQRLEQQLNPLSAILRPIISQTSSWRSSNWDENNANMLEFCKALIETYLAVLIHMESQRSKHESIVNALSTFRLTYEDNQFAIESSKFKPISAGCAHSACVVDGVAYFWGSNGVPCNYTGNKMSEPPEPPHAVKCLEVLSQLNLEVHTVKCGRQHSLVLTNNGLYTFGNNNVLQLGIGSHMLMSLQPMLVQALDGKNITILEAGQYHNAVVADGFLYTWGWGVYGQLGHGDMENVATPKIVSFFKYKKVLQVALGHAHTLVLCRANVRDQQKSSTAGTTELYVFGSNHFGQLGTGLTIDADNSVSNPNNSQVKALLPIKIDVSDAKIRLIHTKFFSNLVVDENDRLYTWGSSPQALRLANQVKKRANAKQKIEELQRREISKRFEETTLTKISNDVISPNIVIDNNTSDEANRTLPNDDSAEKSTNLAKDISAAEEHKEIEIDESEKPNNNICDTKDIEVNIVSKETAVDDQLDAKEVLEIQIDEIDLIAVDENENGADTQKESSVSKEEDDLPSAAPPPSVENEDQKNEIEEPKQQPAEDMSSLDHMNPRLVNTSKVDGKIIQVSSGLFHFALISSTSTLYTWGKNLEHQLGTEDRDRRAVFEPSPLENFPNPMFVECGADFTLVMTSEFVVKAVGGNTNGQCGRDFGPTIDKMKHRVVCLPATKRIMRYEGECVDVPVEINLPRPRIRLDSEPVRYMKSIPRYQPHFMLEAGISLETFYDRSADLKSTPTENIIGQESDDLISSIENLSLNDPSSGNMEGGGSTINQSSSKEEDTPEEQSYTRLPPSENFDPSGGGVGGETENVNSNPKQSLSPTETDNSSESISELRNYIHYCLYVFHGLYDPEKIEKFSKNRLEYRIRTLMLNFKFVEAFALCLTDCSSAHKSLKIFEYFTKDTSFVPMRRQDLKFFIYRLFAHFISQKFDLVDCEQFFIVDLDYYLLELSYVLYFNNNNSDLEQSLNQKFKSLIIQDPNQNDECELGGDTDAIFDCLSVKFKTIVCQRLLKHLERLSFANDKYCN